MKNRIWIFILIGLLGFTACDKSEDLSLKSIEGTYAGNLTLKSDLSGSIRNQTEGTAIVLQSAKGEIEVHCFGGEFDSTFVLSYFNNHDSVMVCLTDSNFQHFYGHMMGQGHMSGGMMGDIQKGQTEWQHHMIDEHKSGDKHFGGFDMTSGNFGYSFKMPDGYMTFSGHRK